MSEFLSELIGENEITALKELRVVWCKDTLWVTNYIKIVSFLPEKIVLKIRNNQLILDGIGLKIDSMSPKEIVIRGRVNGIELEKKFLSEKAD